MSFHPPCLILCGQKNRIDLRFHVQSTPFLKKNQPQLSLTFLSPFSHFLGNFGIFPGVFGKSYYINFILIRFGRTPQAGSRPSPARPPACQFFPCSCQLLVNFSCSFQAPRRAAQARRSAPPPAGRRGALFSPHTSPARPGRGRGRALFAQRGEKRVAF